MEFNLLNTETMNNLFRQCIHIVKQGNYSKQNTTMFQKQDKWCLVLIYIELYIYDGIVAESKIEGCSLLDITTPYSTMGMSVTCWQ